MSQSDTSPTERLECPYVGMRPFKEEEQSLFFGRSDDSHFLVNKILASRTTLLYALSGIGKSSLLQARVIPQLRDDADAVVCFFSDVAGEDPTAALKRRLGDLASQLGISDVDVGAPTTVELVRMIASVTGQPVVLILDQFEEFLINHANDVDSLKKELVPVVRAENLDVHLVISMREEYIVDLEPFRDELPGLYKSTYRLKGLDEEGIDLAIQAPAEAFGVTYEMDLLQRIKEDVNSLSKVQKSTIKDLDLAIVQLVCKELWTQAEISSPGTLTLQAYLDLGGADTIIKEYLARVMPRDWKERHCIAKLLIPLAPPSGVKLPFTAEDLSRICDVDQPDVESGLQRLVESDVLDDRESRNGRRFELQHDKYIEVLGPWRDEVLMQANQRAKTAKYVRGSSLAVIVLAAAGVLSAIISANRDRAEVRRLTVETLANLDSMGAEEVRTRAPDAFDTATSYMLYNLEGPERFDLLRNLLIEHSVRLPDDYGIKVASDTTLATLTGSGLDTSDALRPALKVTYSASRALNEAQFLAGWEAAAPDLTRAWGIPVPRRVWIDREVNTCDTVQARGSELLPVRGEQAPNDCNQLEEEEVRLTGSWFEAKQLRIDTDPDAVYVPDIPARLSSQAREFYERFSGDWQETTQILSRGSIVPYWSLPVWNVSQQTGFADSGLTAFRLADELQRNPEILISPQALAAMLENVHPYFTPIVDEAIAARGESLRQDLIELMRANRPDQSTVDYRQLRNALDLLAQYPNGSSGEVAQSVRSDLQAFYPSIPDVLNGPWPDADASDPRDIDLSFDILEVQRELPGYVADMRAYVGSSLENELLMDEVQSSVFRRVRESFVRRFGFDILEPSFYSASASGIDSPADGFRIYYLNWSDPIEAIEADFERPIDLLTYELTRRAAIFRMHWLTSQAASTILDDLHPELRRWIEARYSLTDLRSLLRGVIAPEPGVDEAVTLEILEDHIGGPPENTISRADWLLESLPFWTQFAGLYQTNGLVQGLRATQSARMYPTRDVGLEEQSSTLANVIHEGIQALDAAEFEQASQIFSRAVSENAEEARDLFLQAYKSRVGFPGRKLSQQCDDLERVALTLPDVINLENFVAADSERPRMAICLSEAYANDGEIGTPFSLQSLIKDYGEPNTWNATDAAWLGLVMLRRFDPLASAAEVGQQAQEVLRSAFAPGRLGNDESANFYYRLTAECSEAGAREWCWDFVTELQQVRPTAAITTELAYRLAHRESPDTLHLAIELADAADLMSTAENLSEATIEWYRDYNAYSRAVATERLGYLEDNELLAEAETGYRSLLESAPLGETATSDLADYLIEQERFAEARELLADAFNRWPDSFWLNVSGFWLGLLSGDSDLAAAYMGELSNEPDNGMFISAVGAILLERSDREAIARRFLETSHPYVNYVAMLLYEVMSDRPDAENFLRQRWDSFDSRNWDARAQYGDPAVWREMLLGYYFGQVTESEIFDPLVSDAAFESSLFANLPLPRLGMLCEAYFYDAMLARANAEQDSARAGEHEARMLASLEETIATNYRSYYEFKMAKYLLESIED